MVKCLSVWAAKSSLIYLFQKARAAVLAILAPPGPQHATTCPSSIRPSGRQVLQNPAGKPHALIQTPGGLFYNQYYLMELGKTIEETVEPQTAPSLQKRHWSFHFLVLLSVLQVMGHLIDHYHLILLKPLPIILLILLCETRTRQEKVFMLGLVFSLGGDLCLMVSNAVVFQIGTLCFMVAHVLYIRAFLYDISWRKLTELKRTRIGVLMLFISFILTLLMFNISQLWHKTPNLPLFFVYGLVLSMMAITASLREKYDSSYVLILLGALFFGISDNTLAFLKFNHIESELGSAFIMLTYYSAQCLLFEGVRVNSPARP